MFDMVTGKARHIPNHNAVPLLISSIAEAAAITLVVALPLLFLAQQVPEVPSIMAFVAAVPPPPPPPPPAPRAATARPQAAAAGASAIPIEAPSEIRPEPPGVPVDEGVPGGVEGGIPGGVVGGIAGGLVDAPPPPPPPPPQEPSRPVRIAGELKPPALLKRVEPEYPRLAIAANVTGVVILEATVDERGDVTDVRVLRSVHALVDAEAIKAVKQWRYSPLTLNGHLSPFILTVTLSFSLTHAAG